MIEREIHDGIAIVRLAHGPANALDAELLTGIGTTFAGLTTSPVRAVVLTGSGSVFSAGAELFRVLEEGADYLQQTGEAFRDAFTRLFTFPRPVVAAINGHAIAGGCVLECACDYRIAAAGDYRIGLAELRVGVPFPAIALEIVRFAVGPPHMQSLVYTGRLVGPEEARAVGLVDEVVPEAEMLDRAFALAGRLAAIPAETFALTKKALRAPALEQLARTGADIDAEAAQAWGSVTVREAISRFLIKTFGTDKR